MLSFETEYCQDGTDIDLLTTDYPRSADCYMDRAIVGYCRAGYKEAVDDCLRAIIKNDHAVSLWRCTDQDEPAYCFS